MWLMNQNVETYTYIVTQFKCMHKQKKSVKE